MRTITQYSFQSSNYRGKATQYRDLIRGVFLEEIAHMVLVQNNGSWVYSHGNLISDMIRALVRSSKVHHQVEIKASY